MKEHLCAMKAYAINSQTMGESAIQQASHMVNHKIVPAEKMTELMHTSSGIKNIVFMST